MDDKNLLELAAKAEGHAYPWVLPDRGGERPWNPLTDDGDALRLAVRVRIDVAFYPEFPGSYEAFARASWHATDEDYGEIDQPTEQDPDAATRRAITRAAAEIARATAQKEHL